MGLRTLGAHEHWKALLPFWLHGALSCQLYWQPKSHTNTWCSHMLTWQLWLPGEHWHQPSSPEGRCVLRESSLWCHHCWTHTSEGDLALPTYSNSLGYLILKPPLKGFWVNSYKSTSKLIFSNCVWLVVRYRQQCWTYDSTTNQDLS